MSATLTQGKVYKMEPGETICEFLARQEQPVLSSDYCEGEAFCVVCHQRLQPVDSWVLHDCPGRE